MIRKDTDELIAFLNELVALDRGWVQAMVEYRPPCNKAVADHPTVQVFTEPFKAGLLGLLNGYCGAYDDGPDKGCGPIAGQFDRETGELLGFVRFDQREVIEKRG